MSFTLKICTKCKKRRRSTSFYNKHNNCIDCYKKTSKEYRVRKPEIANKYYQKLKKDPAKIEKNNLYQRSYQGQKRYEMKQEMVSRVKERILDIVASEDWTSEESGVVVEIIRQLKYDLN